MEIWRLNQESDKIKNNLRPFASNRDTEQEGQVYLPATIFSDHSGMKLEINNKRKTEKKKSTVIWKLSNTHSIIRVESESESEVAQLCPTLCGPMDCSPSGSSVHGILQARILEWVAISFSRGSS